MVNKIDSLDLKIMYYLHNDGPIPITDLADKVGSSRQTVANRLKRLTDEELIAVKGGLNIVKFDIKMACVGLAVTNEDTRRGIEKDLMDCPRVAAFFRTPEKANMHLEVWGKTITPSRQRSNPSAIARMWTLSTHTTWEPLSTETPSSMWHHRKAMNRPVEELAATVIGTSTMGV